MLIKLIKPTYFHFRTKPTEVGSVIEVDKWKGDELILSGNAVEYVENAPIAVSKKKSKVETKVEPKVEKTEPIEAHKTTEE